MTSSDFAPEHQSKVHALYQCEDEIVTVQFLYGSDNVGEPFTFSQPEAVRFGERVMRTGLWDNFPIEGVSIASVKYFAQRLRDYGRDGK